MIIAVQIFTFGRAYVHLKRSEVEYDSITASLSPFLQASVGLVFSEENEALELSWEHGHNDWRLNMSYVNASHDQLYRCRSGEMNIC